MNPVENRLSEREKEILRSISEYLKEEGYRFHFLAEDCIELYIQGAHLVLRILIYIYNRHLVIRVPAFLRNIDLKRMDVLLLLMEVMNNYFDIRFELSDDGQHLSGAVNHILEDGTLTKTQFMQCLTVTAFLIDETYPRLMRIIYGQDSKNSFPKSSIEQEQQAVSDEDKSEPLAEKLEDSTKSRKIN